MSQLPKPLVAFIDDDERVLRTMQLMFRNTHDVFITTDPDEYLDYMRFNKVHVAVSDQRMPICTGVEILREIKEISPHTMRILLTGYADLGAIIDSINEGEIYRYLTKPCKTEELKQTIYQATQIAEQNFMQAKSTPAVPSPLEEDYLHTMVGMLNMDEPALAHDATTTPAISPIVTMLDAGTTAPLADTPLEKTAVVSTHLPVTTHSPVTTPQVKPATQLLPSKIHTTIADQGRILEKLLVIDDSPIIQEKVQQQFLGKYEVLYAQNLEEAYEHLVAEDIGVCITDVMVANESVTPVIYTLKQKSPSLVVLIQTQFQDATTLIDLINKGQVFRCLPKPIRTSLLEVSVTRAFDYHHKLKNNPVLAQRHEVEVDDTLATDSHISSKVKGLVGRLRQQFT